MMAIITTIMMMMMKAMMIMISCNILVYCISFKESRCSCREVLAAVGCLNGREETRTILSFLVYHPERSIVLLWLSRMS